MTVVRGLPKPSALTVLGIAVSVVCVVAVVWWILNQPAPTWPSADHLYWIGLALLLDVANYLLRGWRWHRVMSLADIEHATGDAVALTAVGYMGNNVLPARGGEVLRIALLPSPASRWEIAGSVVADRILDGGALLVLFCGLTWFGVAGGPTGRLPGLIGTVLLLLGAGEIAAYVWARRRGFFERFAARIRPVASGARGMLRPEGAYLLALSLLIWMIQAVGFMFIGRSLGIDLAPLEATAILIFASIVALVPAAAGYAGTFDAGIGIGLAAVGVKGGEAVGFLLLTRFVVFVPITIVGAVILLLRYRTGWGAVTQSAVPPGAK